MIPTGNLRLTDFANIASVIKPVNLATGANNGDWINLANFQRVAIILFFEAGTAANDATLTAQQAQDNSGTGAKALTFTRLDVKQGSDLEAIGQFTETTQSASETYTSATNGEEEGIYVLDFAAEDLDIDNDFDHVRINVAQVGAAKVGAALAIAYGPKFGSVPAKSIID